MENKNRLFVLLLLISIIFVCEINLKNATTITILLITNTISMYSKRRCVFLLLFYIFQFVCLYANASYNLRKLSNQDGLSNSAVLCIHQDRNGFMWFGTYDGLNFYDGKNFQLFRMEYGNKYSLSSNIIHKIVDAGGDDLWVCTYLGVNKFSISQHRVTESYKQYRDPCSIASTRDGLTWLIGKKNYISYYDINKHCFRELYLSGINPEEVEAFFIDNRNLLWIFSSKHGVWNIHTNYPKEKDNKKIRLIKKNAVIHDFAIQNAYYDKGLIYFVDIRGMFFVYNVSHNHKVFIKNISHLLRRYGSLSSIISNHGDFLIAFKGKGTIKLVAQQHYSEEVVDLNTGVFNLYPDNNQDIVWIGTDGQGVGLYYKNRDFFNSIMLDWLPIKVAKPVRSIYTDKYNSLWIGTKGDGIIRIPNYDKTLKDKAILQKTSHFTTETGLSNDQVFALVGSKYKNILWVATNGPELSYYSYSDNRVHSVINKTKTGINYVHSLYEENDSTLWLATDGNGLIKLIINGNVPIIKVKSAKSFLFKKGSKIASELFSMTNDNKSNIWLGCRGFGAVCFNTRTNQYKFITLNDENNYAVNDILCVHGTNDSILYFGSSSGLTKMQINKDFSLKNVNGENGYINDMIHGILEDNSGCLWLSTNKGLIKYNPNNKFSHKYFYREGLTVVEFSDNAYYHCPYTNRLFFGGINGLVWLEPGAVDQKDYYPKVYFTGLKILGDKKNIFDYVKGKDNHIELPSKMNSFAVSFIAPDYINGSNYEYSYFLENYSKEWKDLQNYNEVTFSDLPPGQYVLKVKYKSDVFTSENKCYELSIIILNPWYWTIFARIVYFVFFILLCLFLMRLGINKIKSNKQDLLNKLQEQKKEELYNAKLDFFTNITHEFCTPLTLINGVCERILSYGKSDEYVQKYTNVLYNNAKQLNELIQEIIDFRKFGEVGFDACHIEKVCISELLDNQVLSFIETAESKDITIKVNVDNELYWNTDTLCMNKIFMNLISNAFKYTPQGGLIKVTAFVENDFLKFIIKNTGEGIEDKDLDLIFDRYRILDNMNKNDCRDALSRNGLGLAICYNMVKLLHGQIHVKSEINNYTEFLVDFPLLPLSYSSQNKPENEEQALANFDKEINYVSDKNTQPQLSLRSSVLIIDDNKDIVWLVSDILSADYDILKAYNADEAFKILENQSPALIITDIMMPGQNGFDLTKQIRMNKYTCTVPIIVISARNTEEDKVKGISNGADAYLTKPFSSMILKSMVDRLVMNKQILKNYYNSPESAYQYINGHLTHQDDKDFLESVIQIIKTNIEKDSLGPEFVASEMGLNVRKFYRKFKEASQLAPSDFIKDYRFSYAAKLLLSTNMSVQEVIYKVGIINKSYFYREFSKKYNMTPKEYRLQKNETTAK